MNSWQIGQVWDAEKVDKLDQYLQYLTNYNPQRLEQQDVLLNDLRVLSWRFFHQLDPHRKATKDELSIALWMSLEGQSFGVKTPTIPDATDIQSNWSPKYTNVIVDYINYLMDESPERLDDWERFIEDIQILTWEVFSIHKNRLATIDELIYILRLALVEIERSGKVITAHSLKHFANE